MYNMFEPICTCMLMIRCRSPLVKACPTSSACSLWIKRFSSERSRWQRFSSGRKYQGSKFFKLINHKRVLLATELIYRNSRCTVSARKTPFSLSLVDWDSNLMFIKFYADDYPLLNGVSMLKWQQQQKRTFNYIFPNLTLNSNGTQKNTFK